MPFRGDTQREPASQQLDTPALADACNDDPRFRAAKWVETPVSVESLFLSKAFDTAVSQLVVSGALPGMAVLVAAAYRCRVAEWSLMHRKKPVVR
ncbi:MAG: hypothetical protein EXR51_10955 [Dehalococcoidia bacterium]|nr:hypothetical protein [Dehalococcoidia bacterium]